MAFRELCPALLNKTYFNYGGQGPLPTPSLEAIQASWRRIQELGPFTTDVWPFIGAEVSSTRRRLAQLCGVAPHRLALSENVTSGCVLPLWGLPFTTGDRLLISDCEHPGVVAACVELARREGLEIDTLPVQQLRGDQPSTDAGVMDALEQGLTPRTRLVVLSHLLWNTGQIMPITAVAERLALHPQSPYLLVDAAQSFGQIPVQQAAAAADIYAFTGHKWACGPEGLGGVALSERVLAQGQPTVIGWRSLQDESKADLSSSDPFHHDSRRFEVATSCVPLMAGLRCSLDLLDKEGTGDERWARIQSRSEGLWQALNNLDGLTPLLHVPPASGLVSFQLRHDAAPAEVVQQLGQQGLWIRDLADPRCLRACTHVTTTEAEAEALTTVIARY
jgi:L-cysteine/cystine lyase